MKKLLPILLLVTIFTLGSFACDNCDSHKENLTKEEKIQKNIEQNTNIYIDLLDEISELTSYTVSGNYSLREKKEFLKKLQARIKTAKYIITHQLNPEGRYEDIASSSQKCAACGGSGCDVCGWDGTVFIPGDEPVQCGRCGGDGIDPTTGGPCKGCKGSGWGDALPNPKRSTYY